MNSKTKLKTLALVVATSAIMTNVYAVNGNGDGYQGPTLAPDVMTVNFDKAIDVKKVMEVMISCTLPYK